jgi:hypothetical protein
MIVRARAGSGNVVVLTYEDARVLLSSHVHVTTTSTRGCHGDTSQAVSQESRSSEIQEARCNKAGQLGTVGQVGIAPWRQERKTLGVQKDVGKAQQNGGREAWKCGKEAITYATRDECGEGTY